MAFKAFSKVTPTTKPNQTKKIVARAPTPNQRRTGKLSPSNVKYLLARHTDPKADPQLSKAIKKHFGTLEQCRAAINA
jgi:superoxide dismutase